MNVSWYILVCPNNFLSFARFDYPTDLKPENILLLPSDLDKIVMHELSGRPAAIYGFQKNTPPNELPFHPVFSAPLSFTLETKGDSKMHWIVADMGHGAWT